jgi:hypothetical protein
VLPLNGVDAGALDTRAFFNDVMVLPVKAATLGLKDGASRITFRIKVDPWGDTTGTYTFDPTKPAFAFAGSAPQGGAAVQPMLRDLPGESVTVSFDKSAVDADGSKGILLLHHTNAAELRAQAIPVAFGACQLSLSVTASGSTMAGAATTFAVAATASSCADALGYDWDFGDDSAHGSGASVAHVYAKPGVYRWRLIAASGVFSAQATGSITVLDPDAQIPRRRVHPAS